MCEPVTTPWPPTPAMRILKRFAMSVPPLSPLRERAVYAFGRAAAGFGRYSLKPYRVARYSLASSVMCSENAYRSVSTLLASSITLSVGMEYSMLQDVYAWIYVGPISRAIRTAFLITLSTRRGLFGTTVAT